ncbi:hypothetical protein [Nostoc sp.]|uniref:hypothetical protein n=1 Tax=Nostoc sp. TaxID=1180 RepID=UPI002FF4D99D
MCAKEFGQSQPTKIDKLIESAVRYCHKRHPEALDSIFDYLPVNRQPTSSNGDFGSIAERY